MKKLPLAIIVFVGLVLLAILGQFSFGTKSDASVSAQTTNPQDSIKRQIRTGADEATLAARDASQRLIQVQVRSEEDREAAMKLGTLIEDYGSFVVVAAESKKVEAARKVGQDAAPIETRISLRGYAFEPLKEDPEKAFAASSSLLKEEKSGGDYYLVQFAAPVRDEWIEELRAAGGEVVQYVPNQAFFVYATPDAMATIAEHPRVRWTGVFHPAYKLSPQMRTLATRQNGQAEKGLFDIAIFAKTDINLTARTVADFGITVKNQIVLPNNYFNVLRVEMEVGLSLPVVQVPGVISVEPYIPPAREDERAAQIIAGNFTSTTQLNAPGYNSLGQFGVDGTNVTVSVVDDGVGIPGDGGFYVTSGKSVNAPLRGAAAGAEGHGHLNASIIAGDVPFSVLDPLGYNYGLGIARKANIVNVPLLRAGYSGTEFDTCNDTITTAGPNGVNGYISNNSWGAGTNGNAYDSFAAQYDGFVRDSSSAATVDPLVIVFSAGNQGSNGLTRPKMAKNLIAVANSENIRTELSASANNIDDLSSSSSRGPAADTRIKPDITAPGTAITGGRSGPDVLFGNIDEVHRWSSGTSHAAPQIAGAAALFTQFWKANNSGANPSPALIKAALINGTQEMNGVGTSATIPNGAEGWGRLNLKNVLNTGVATKYVNQTSTLSNVGQEVAFTGSVAVASSHFRVSLVWTDPPGVSDPALVNNLDLEVTVGGTTYKGNVFGSGLSTSGGTADIRNNVENVFLASNMTVGTPVTIRVRATGLNGDGAMGNADPTDQHFALVAFNFSEGPVVAPLRAVKDDFDGDGKTDFSVWRGPQGDWQVIRSGSGGVQGQNWGTSSAPYNDIAVPGDYDGDGRFDIAVWRPLDGNWFIVNSSNAAILAVQWGIAGDIPVPGDYDGDKKTDIAVWRGQESTWYIRRSSDNQPQVVMWGAQFAPYNDVPVAADYDGDGKTDIAVFRQQTASWFIIRSSNTSVQVQQWGSGTDSPVPGDYDGDGKHDIAVWRPSDGNWYILRSSDSQPLVTNWGTAAAPYRDIAVPGDYDGDGKADLAVWRPLNATWYVIRSTNGQFIIQPHGQSGDTPVPATGVR